MTTKRDIYQSGFDRGYSIADYQEIPAIGYKVPRDIDNCIVETVHDNSDKEDVFYALCYSAEENNRSYSPFEFTAKDLNDLQESKPYDVWQVFDDGISSGMRKNYRERTRKQKKVSK
jgi:hypothetical protein